MAEANDPVLEEMVKTIDSNPDYKVLTKDEYDALLALATHGGDKSPVTKTSTPDVGARPKTTLAGKSPVPPRLHLLHLAFHLFPG